MIADLFLVECPNIIQGDTLLSAIALKQCTIGKGGLATELLAKLTKKSQSTEFNNLLGFLATVTVFPEPEFV